MHKLCTPSSASPTSGEEDEAKPLTAPLLSRGGFPRFRFGKKKAPSSLPAFLQNQVKLTTSTPLLVCIVLGIAFLILAASHLDMLATAHRHTGGRKMRIHVISSPAGKDTATKGTVRETGVLEEEDDIMKDDSANPDTIVFDAAGNPVVHEGGEEDASDEEGPGFTLNSESKEEIFEDGVEAEEEKKEEEASQAGGEDEEEQDRAEQEAATEAEEEEALGEEEPDMEEEAPAERYSKRAQASAASEEEGDLEETDTREYESIGEDEEAPEQDSRSKPVQPVEQQKAEPEFLKEEPKKQPKPMTKEEEQAEFSRAQAAQNHVGSLSQKLTGAQVMASQGRNIDLEALEAKVERDLNGLDQRQEERSQPEGEDEEATTHTLSTQRQCDPDLEDCGENEEEEQSFNQQETAEPEGEEDGSQEEREVKEEAAPAEELDPEEEDLAKDAEGDTVDEE